MIIWYTAKESINHGKRHLRTHRRLGDAYTKCGKTVDDAVDPGRLRYYAPCLQCCEQDLKEQAREAELPNPVAPPPAAVAPRVVIHLRDTGAAVVALKPQGVRVEVVDFRTLPATVAPCDMPELTCQLHRPHRHAYFYEEQQIPKEG